MPIDARAVFRRLDRKGRELEAINLALRADPRLSPEGRKLVDALAVQAAALALNKEKMRPIAEHVRDFKAIVDDAAQRYVDDVAPLIAGNVDGDLIEDGRAAQGVSRMTKKDMDDLITVLNSLKTVLDGVGIMDTVRKPTVQPLRVG